MCLKESRARGEQPERDCVWERLLQSRLVSRHRPPPIPWHLSTHLITHSHSTPPTTPSSASASLCVPVCATRKGTELNLRCAATVQHVLYQLSTLDSAIKRATPWTTRTKSWSQVSFAFDRKIKKQKKKWSTDRGRHFCKIQDGSQFWSFEPDAFSISILIWG